MKRIYLPPNLVNNPEGVLGFSVDPAKGLGLFT